MSADGELRRAERSGDRAELVRAMVRAGLGREAVARCGLHVGDVVRRARNHRGRSGRRGRAWVLARTLDLVEPGDGEQVLAPQPLTAILTPADRG